MEPSLHPATVAAIVWRDDLGPMFYVFFLLFCLDLGLCLVVQLAQFNKRECSAQCLAV